MRRVRLPWPNRQRRAAAGEPRPGRGRAAERLAARLPAHSRAFPTSCSIATGRPRDYWLHFLGDLAEYADEDFRSRFSLATRHIRDTGVSYRIYGEDTERSWPLKPLPLILGEAEWAKIAAGVEQRANLMEALLQDLYGEASLVAEGALPAAALTGSPDFIRAVRGVKPPGGRYLQLYAADLGRGPDGRWWVLDDRTQAPSGAGYALENRLVLSRAYPNLYNAMNVQRLAPFFDDLRKGLAAAADRTDPRICLLTPGPFSETYFEQAHLARYLGFLLVEGDDLVVRDGRVYVRTIAGLKRADVILRRVDADFIDPLELNSASQPRRAGPAGRDPRRRRRGAQHAGLGRAGIQGPARLPAQALPAAAGRRAEAAQCRHLVVRPAGRAGAGGGAVRHLVVAPAFNVQRADGTFDTPAGDVGHLSGRARRASGAHRRSAGRFRRPGGGAPVHHARAARRPAGAGAVRAARLRRGDRRRAGDHARRLLPHLRPP